MRKMFPVLLLLILAACVHRPRPQIPVPPAPAPAIDMGVLPFSMVLDSKLAAANPTLSAELRFLDSMGDHDGVFTRGDAWAAGPDTQLFADLHIHPFMAKALPFLFGMPDGKHLAGSPSTILANQITLPALRRGAWNVLFSSVYVSPLHITKRWQMHEALRQIAVARQFAADHPGEMEIAYTAEDVRRIVSARKVAIVLCVEGAHMVDKPSDVDRLWDAGIRLMTLTHFTNNGIAGAAFSTISHPENFHYFGHHTREEGVALNRVGLTPLGKQVVRRMAELGMIVDLAHASDAAVKDVLAETAAHPVPVVITHTALRAYHPAERNESDELIRAVADRGGVIGLTTWRIELDTSAFDECQAFATHFRRLLELVGPEHVGIGTDFNGLVMRTRGCGKGADGVLRTGVRNVGDMPELLQSLVDGGVPPRVLQSMGSNMLRVMEETQRLALPRGSTP